jgi:hypothetical protein
MCCMSWAHKHGVWPGSLSESFYLSGFKPFEHDDIVFSLSKMKLHFLVSVFSCEFMPQHSLLPLSCEP